MRIEFGSYVQVFEDCNPSNTPRARSLGAIALTPTGNSQGDYYFMSLATGSRLSRHRWVELPIPDTAIARVEAIALEEGQPLLQESGLVVEWHPDQPIDDSEYDQDYAPPADFPDDHLATDEYDPIDERELADLQNETNDEAELVPVLHDNEANPTYDDDGDREGDVVNENHSSQQTPETDLDADNAHAEDDIYTNSDFDRDLNDNLSDEDEFPIEEESATTENDQVSTPDTEAARDGQEGTETVATAQTVTDTDPVPRYDLRDRSANRTDFKAAIDNPHSSKSYFPPQRQLFQSGCLRSKQRYVIHYIMTQMTARAGIKNTGRLPKPP